jgi:hypothetical protein
MYRILMHVMYTSGELRKVNDLESAECETVAGRPQVESWLELRYNDRHHSHSGKEVCTPTEIHFGWNAN